MEIDLLGRFAVRRDGREVDAAEYGGRRVRQLIRMLAAERGRVVTRDALIEALWGGRLPADPAANLNVIVNRARRALGAADLIRTSSGGYLLADGTEIVVDAEEFARHVQDARTAAPGAAGGTLKAVRAAVDLWSEPLAEDRDAEWARPHRDRLERMYLEALETGASAALALGHTSEAVDLASQAVARQPLREAAHLLVMRSLAADGDQAAAITAYLGLRTMLADELGVDPSPEATELYERLLRNEIPVRRGPAAARRRRDLPPLVGRERELAALAQLGSEHRIAVVSGRSGWGKSRLVETACLGSDRTLLLSRALLAEREEPWSLVRTLLQTPAGQGIDVRGLLGGPTLSALHQVLGGALPGLEPSDAVVDAESARALARQGVVRVLEATAPSLVVVDDLQWADSSSLEVLAVLAERSADTALLLAYRPEEVPEGSAVARFLSVIAESRPLDVALPPLDGAALGELVPDPVVTAALAEHTDSTPYAVLQVLRTLENDGLLRRRPGGSWEVLDPLVPERVREVARAGQRETAWRHFERQPPAARDLLGCLALMGRPAPMRLLAAACDLDPETAMSLLGGLARAHLLRHDADGFRADHDLVGETVRDRLDPVDRARLHQRLAAVLAEDHTAADDLARHLEGAGDRAAAAAAYALAARSRLQAFATTEARLLAERGLALDPVDPAVRADLLEAHAETLARQDDLAGARDGLRRALRAATAAPARARLLTRLAALTAGAEDMVRAGELADLALAEAGDDVSVRGRARYVRAMVDMNLGDAQAAGRQYDAALEDFRAVGDAVGIGDILDARAMTAFGEGDVRAGVVEFDHAARLFADSGNLLRAMTPRSIRAHALTFADRAEEGLADSDLAWEFARSLGFADGEAMVLWHRSETLVACGRAEEGLHDAQRGLAIARRLGHRGWTATTLRAQGIAQLALGDLEAARQSLEESLRTCGEHLIMFACWARSQLALVHLLLDDLPTAASYVEAALASGPGLSQHEARLAACELAVRRGDPDAPERIEAALRRAHAGGHLLSARRLDALREEVGAA